MTELDRMIGGVRCRDVLARLSEYLDGELAGQELALLEAHVRECDRCGRFGGRFAEVIEALRAAAPLPPADAGRAARLWARLAREGER